MATADGTMNFGMAGGRVSELGVWLVNLHGGELLPLLFGGDRPTQIRCGAAAFAVDDGLATLNLFVFDTDESNITGYGTVDLGQEALDITLEPQAQEGGPSLFARSGADPRHVSRRRFRRVGARPSDAA